MASLVGSGLFGDGAAAVVAVGERPRRPDRARARRARHPQPALSRLPAHDGLGRRRQRASGSCSSADVPELVERYLGRRRHRLPRRPRSRRRRHRHLGVRTPAARRCSRLSPRPLTCRRRCAGADLALAGRDRQPVVGLGAARARDTLRQAAAAAASPGVLMAMGPGSAPSWSCCAGTERCMLCTRADRRGGARAHGGTGGVEAQPALEPGPRRRRVRRGPLPGDGRAAHRTAGGAWSRSSPDRPFLPGAGLADARVVLAAQALRWWCIATLGRRWNTRVVVVPTRRGSPAARTGSLPHPNYVAVVVEGVALPLVHTAWVTALVFTVLNAVLLRVRITVENAALARLR